MVTICQGFRLYYLQTNYNLFIIKFTNAHVKTAEMYKPFSWNGKLSNYVFKNRQKRPEKYKFNCIIILHSKNG